MYFIVYDYLPMSLINAVQVVLNTNFLYLIKNINNSFKYILEYYLKVKRNALIFICDSKEKNKFNFNSIHNVIPS